MQITFLNSNFIPFWDYFRIFLPLMHFRKDDPGVRARISSPGNIVDAKNKGCIEDKMSNHKQKRSRVLKSV